MKRVLCLMLVSIIIVFCVGCGKIDEKNVNYDEVYNSKTGIYIQLGESAESVKDKLGEEEYEVLESKNGDYGYSFEKDGVDVLMFFQDDKISNIGLSLSSAESSENQDEDAISQSGWVFKNGITLGVTKEALQKEFGKPYSEYSENSHRYDCNYYYNDKFEMITQADYEKIKNGESSDKVTSGSLMIFVENKLEGFFIGLWETPEVLIDLDATEESEEQ